MIAAAINTHALAKMAYSSVLAGVGVTVVFSIAILGVARSSEMRRQHRTAGASVILAASSAGYPLSTTHVISGSIMGAGAAKRLSAVRWGVAGNIVGAWTLTLPAAAIMGAVVYALCTLFGHGAIGPLLISLALLLTLGAVFIRRLQQVEPAPVAP